MIRTAIDDGLLAADGNGALFRAAGLFAAVIVVNFAASFVQERTVGRFAENVLFDIRGAMLAHDRTLGRDR